MPKYIINELDFTPEELAYLESEMRKYKVPWIYKIVFGSLYKWGKYFMPLFFLVIVVMGIIHMSTNLDLWNPIKILAFIFIFGIGGLVFISWVWNRIKVLNECKRLNLTLQEWHKLATVFQIVYI
jgi:hypothetical protein